MSDLVFLRNFAAIATAAESGEDVTEAVLLQLLPHRRCAVQHAHPLA